MKLIVTFNPLDGQIQELSSPNGEMYWEIAALIFAAAAKEAEKQYFGNWKQELQTQRGGGQ